MKKPATASAKRKSTGAEDLAASYDAYKEFEGRTYTGMKVGRGHKWIYDRGEWKETKVAPDRWEIQYAVTKRRKGRAPEGSGVPVGTGYHWFILAHQHVTKLNANDYTTSMTGMKYKLAHKRADKGTWSASSQAQRRSLIKIFQQILDDLERDGAEHGTPLARMQRVAASKAPAGRTLPVKRTAAKTPKRPKRTRAA